MKRIISLCSLFCVAALGMVFVCCTSNAPVKEQEGNNTETTVSDSTGMVAAVNNIKSHQEDIQALWEMSIGKDKKFTKYALANDCVVLGTEDGKDRLLLSFYKDMKDIDNFDGIELKEGQELSFQGSGVIVKDGDKTTYYEKTENEGFNCLFTVTEKDGKKTYTDDDDKPYDEKEAQSFIDKIGKEEAKSLADVLGEWNNL